MLRILLRIYEFDIGQKNIATETKSIIRVKCSFKLQQEQTMTKIRNNLKGFREHLKVPSN